MLQTAEKKTGNLSFIADLHMVVSRCNPCVVANAPRQISPIVIIEPPFLLTFGKTD
jgi:hypothetical protein